MSNFVVERNKKIEEFVELTANDDIVAMFLRGHLFIEREISFILESIILYSEKINLDSMKFSAKFDLACAVGLIDEKWYGPINKLNKIRNLIAHNMDYTYTDKDYEDFVSTLSKSDKSVYEAT